MNRSKCIICGAGLPRGTDKYCKKHRYYIGKCSFCGKEFRCAWYFSSTRKYCSNQCKHAARIMPMATYKCEWCGKEFSKSSKIKYKRFCGRSCISKYTNHVRFGDASNSRITFQCEKCGNVVTRLSSTYVNYAHHFCSRKCYLESRPGFADNKIKNGHRTDIEQIVEDFLISHGIPYDFEFRIGKYTVDFALSLSMVIIECDGEYWHSKGNQPQKDRERDKIISGNGWTIIRLPGKCIKDGSFVDMLSNMLDCFHFS